MLKKKLPDCKQSGNFRQRMFSIASKYRLRKVFADVFDHLKHIYYFLSAENF
ncbi:MAG: hypothetical protein JWO06_3205 [Bacteroidota bacterium]|nr:hypothetical protein [Bacteroidota bacterium]